MEQNNSNLYLDPRAKFIFLPYNCKVPGYQISYREQHLQFKEQLKSNNKPFIDISDYPEQFICYENYPSNWHHFTLQTQYNLIIPKMNELLQFGYNKNDFELVPYFDGEFDLSYLKPKNEYRFIIQCLSNYGGSNDDSIKAGTFIGGFNILMGLDHKVSPEFSKYHNLYRFPHRPSIIINLNATNNRILLLSGDSQNIPQLPILACYFRQIVYLDKRKIDNKLNYSNIKFTDIIFSLYDMAVIEKYLYSNLEI